jgi:16S rRNA (adenine1518-N6/adenine1519-N6)-dimethyltransferase
MKLSEIRDVLTQRGIQLTKSLGQNFLHDGNQLRRIADAAQITAADRILEIGPGLGPLTELLVARAGEVLAIEKDRRLVEFLREKFAAAKNLSLVHDDALDYLKREKRDWSDWKLVANLPYSVASPLLVELAQSRGCPQRLVATLQFEVARRLVARAGDDDYGLLSLLVQLRYEPLELFKISADCFFPAPDVDSACVVLDRREKLLLPLEQQAAFVKLVKLGFSQRRKMMFKLLKKEWPEDKLARAYAHVGLSPQIRAEQVALEQFAELVKELAQAGNADAIE